MHFVYRTDEGEYISTRKATQPRAYTARTTTSSNLSDARIFNTKAAASNAGRRVGSGEALPVIVRHLPDAAPGLDAWGRAESLL